MKLDKNKEYNLDDLILLGEAAKTEAQMNIADALGLDFDLIDIKCDNYDGSLEIYLYKNNAMDIESLMTPENMDKITAACGSTHFWINLCGYDRECDKNYSYKDCHVGWIKGQKPEFWKTNKRYLD